MDKELAKYFFEESSKAFAFVVTEHHFSAPQLEIDEKINFAFVIFMGKNLAIECIFDERERDIDCKIACVTDGKITPHYALDDKGVRVRDGLFTLLVRRGVRKFAFEKIKGELGIRERIKISLTDFARILSEYGQDILADSPTALST